MTKPISTRVHGVLDYMTSAFLCTLPRVMGWDKTVTGLLDSAAIAATGYSLLTRYELGLVRVLPMKAHLTMDAVSGGMLLGAAALMDDEDPEVRAALAGIGLWEIGAALMTRTHSTVRGRGPVADAAASASRQVASTARVMARTAKEQVPALQGL